LIFLTERGWAWVHWARDHRGHRRELRRSLASTTWTNSVATCASESTIGQVSRTAINSLLPPLAEATAALARRPCRIKGCYMWAHSRDSKRLQRGRGIDDCAHARVGGANSPTQVPSARDRTSGGALGVTLFERGDAPSDGERRAGSRRRAVIGRLLRVPLHTLG
jgi:hypothetical protein